MMKKSALREMLAALRKREGEMADLLRAFVECESPSHDKAAVDRFGAMVAKEWRKRGARVSTIAQAERGDHVRAEIAPLDANAKGQVLVLGHLDTVHPLGTLQKMPWRIASGRAWGPGTFDMKAGIVQALFAVDALRAIEQNGQAAASPGARAHGNSGRRLSQRKLRPSENRPMLQKRLVFFWDSDEEIGSLTSRKLIEAEARKSDAVLVLEPSLGPRGHLKTERKGVGTCELIVRGRAAHAGIDPEAGVNAVNELALQIARLMKMHQPAKGITVQATVISGGTTTNVVPAEARAQVDVRCSRLADVARVNKQLGGLRPILKGAQLEVRGGINRPPLERTKLVQKLFRQAQALAGELRFKLGEASTGGGSDGNFTAALGIPTLDGLGAVGDGAHSLKEHVLIRALPERAALLAALLASS
jgi:glutamate carboxypeptidase